MGTCFSNEAPLPSPTTKVISMNGSLHEYNVPVFVSQVLEAEASSSFFLCSSDLLSYDHYIPALDSNAQLYANQLYFVLPRSKIQNRLTASDMAALAVKASVALQKASKKEGHGRKKARISPVLVIDQSPSQPLNFMHNADKTFEKAIRTQLQPPVGFSRSGSLKRLQKYTPRGAKLAVHSFRLRLSTIYEGIVV